MKKPYTIAPADRLGLNREQAAEYIGVSTSLFDLLVGDGRMPKPRKMNARKVWSRPELEAAFAKLPRDDEDEVESESNPYADAHV